ncbi:MAG: hypothetical protein SH847_17715 [Roseiflexaceae bacterium]|nr:hypothetical protein [Roseiflexaceae bacterium]
MATDEDVTDSSIAAAAAFGGWLISLQGCANYPDGSLEVHYSEADQLELPSPQLRSITHCVEHLTARRLRRRYIPNTKHHPNKFKGREWELATDRGSPSPMPLDVDYDSMGINREIELRDLQRDPPNYSAQQLLDGAIGDPEKNQLYAISYDPLGREIFFEFQQDGLRGYHGYLVGAASVPQGIREHLRSRSSTR